jgi:sigma-54 dependent transcriptional regulator, acetoin dehydrogenase operon transcriptional activator AcoR
MGPTLLKLAREIEDQLYSGSSLRERELLHHFLLEQRQAQGAVLAVSENVVITNKAGAGLHFDHGQLWDQIESGIGDDVHRDLRLPEDSAAVRSRAIEHAGSVVGLVIVVEPTSSNPQQAARTPPAISVDAVRQAPGWSELPALLRAAAVDCDRLLVTGEAGVGKRTLLQEAFGENDRPLRELDCVTYDELGAKHWLTRARSLLADRSSPIILSHLEALSPSMRRSLAAILDRGTRQQHTVTVTATWTPRNPEPEPDLRGLIDRLSAEPFELPPLRRRPDDVIARLVEPGASRPTLTRKALERARRHPWPGNYRQLEEFRRWMGRQRRSVIDVADLPPAWARDGAQIRLTPIQTAEAETIARALRAHDGNKAAAASELGISRSSLYRKMQAYRLG